MSEFVLTPQQTASVEHRGSTVLISAAAGSGKTKVLIDRVLRRVETENCNVDDFLMITFTKAAAAELRGKLIARLSDLLAKQPDDRHLQQQLSRVYLAQISTVHAFCANLLRDYAHLLELPADFRICDEQEGQLLKERAMRTTLDKAYENMSDDAELAAVLNMLGAGRDDRELPQLIEQLFTNVQNTVNPERRFAELEQCLDLSGCEDASSTVWCAYLMQEAKTVFRHEEKNAECCLEQIAAEPTLAPYAEAFLKLRALLKALAAAETWQELNGTELDRISLKRAANCANPELQEQLKVRKANITGTVKQWLNVFSRTSEEVLQELHLAAVVLRGLVRLTRSFSVQYRSNKRQRHVLDYNDLEHETLRLLYGSGSTPNATARELSERYTELMVDEYQDTNAVQDAIYAALSAEGRNLFFVGDVKQSIYRFRQADPTIFLEKYNRFAACADAKPGEACRILLSDNFRSQPAILAAANDVFRLCMTPRVGGLYYGENEALRAKGDILPLETPVELHCINSGGASQARSSRAEIEAEFTARRIADMLKNGESIPEGKMLRPVCAKDIVILLRKMKDKAQYYVAALQRRGIACICSNDNLFDAEEVGFLNALLQVIDNPRQDIPLLTVLFSPVFRFTAQELALLRAHRREGDLFGTLQDSEHGAQFLQALETLRAAARQSSLSELLDTADRLLCLRMRYSSVQAQKNIDTFFSLANGFESAERYGLPDFLRYLAVIREKGRRDAETLSGDAVRIMSVHSTKGLEFPVVFLADLSSAMRFRDTEKKVLLDPVLGIACDIYDEKNRVRYPTVAKLALAQRSRIQTLSEEICILYVAMTRAKHRLIMTCCSATMESTLKGIAENLTVPATDSMLEAVKSAGQWVLMAAMTHTEAGALFEVGGYPEQRGVSEYPWKITYQSGMDYLPDSDGRQAFVAAAVSEPLLPWLPLHYGHEAATTAPSKLTATQLKGRAADAEAAEETRAIAPPFRFVRPRFEQKTKLTGAERGTAIHLAMQYLDYSRCTSLTGVQSELTRLLQQHRLTPEQVQAVEPEKLLLFFQSELGRRVLASQSVVREFKFSILEDARMYVPELSGEQMLLQGVTDCCIIEPDGLVILDFKSDYVTRETMPLRAEHYRGQLDAYSRALSRIFRKPVKQRILYFFATDAPFEVS